MGSLCGVLLSVPPLIHVLYRRNVKLNDWLHIQPHRSLLAVGCAPNPRYLCTLLMVGLLLTTPQQGTPMDEPPSNRPRRDSPPPSPVPSSPLEVCVCSPYMFPTSHCHVPVQTSSWNRKPFVPGPMLQALMDSAETSTLPKVCFQLSTTVGRRAQS